jgi:hypothetical protein
MIATSKKLICRKCQRSSLRTCRQEVKQKGITKRTAVGECIEATPLNSIEKSKINPTLMRLSEF